MQGLGGLSSFTSVIRSQWTGIEGAPLTQTLSFNAPITSKNLGFGLSVLNDKIGSYKQYIIRYRFVLSPED